MGVNEAQVPVELEMAFRVLDLVSVLLVEGALVLVESVDALLKVLGKHADKVFPRITIRVQLLRARPGPAPDAVLESEALRHFEPLVVDVLHNPVVIIHDILVAVATAEKRVVTQELVLRNQTSLGVSVYLVITKHVARRVELALAQLPLRVLDTINHRVCTLDFDERGYIRENLAITLLGVGEALLVVDDGQNLEVGLHHAARRLVATLVVKEQVESVVEA
mmetsp:Transcript_30371/g.66361  ORF Transcript_30371/g.66361 Transcript_30371/m.66361 type:complete len:222 (+) Transcript_30371:1116-1781(+)